MCVIIGAFVCRGRPLLPGHVSRLQGMMGYCYYCISFDGLENRFIVGYDRTVFFNCMVKLGEIYTKTAFFSERMNEVQ